MKKYKKNIIWVLFWTVMNVLLSMAYQYFRILPHSNQRTTILSILNGMGDWISFFIVGPILGLVATPMFLLINYFLIRKKIKNKYLLFTTRVIIIIALIIVIFYIERTYF